jgi:hypothetical protein
MAAWAISWLQNKIGVDITGQEEFETHHQLNALKDSCHALSSAVEHEATISQPCGVAALSSRTLRSTECEIMGLSNESSRVSLLECEDLTSEASSPDYKKKDHHSRSAIPSSSALQPHHFVSVSPTTLLFPLPLDKFIMNTIVAKNLTNEHVIFKLRATAPSRYAVKPRHGLLGPSCQETIHVTLRPTDEDHTHFYDRFQLVTRVLSSVEVDYFNRTHDITNLCAVSPDRTTAQKIRCAFPDVLPPNYCLRPCPDIDDDLLVGKINSNSVDDNVEAGEVIATPVTVSHRRHGHTLPCSENY